MHLDLSRHKASLKDPFSRTTTRDSFTNRPENPMVSSGNCTNGDTVSGDSRKLLDLKVYFLVSVTACPVSVTVSVVTVSEFP